MSKNKTRAIEDINISIALDDFGVIPLICHLNLMTLLNCPAFFLSRALGFLLFQRLGNGYHIFLFVAGEDPLHFLLIRFFGYERYHGYDHKSCQHNKGAGVYR